MSIERQAEETRIRTHGARALQLHLYREIGLSAVAAALQSSKLPDVPRAERTSWHSPATLVRENRAA